MSTLINTPASKQKLLLLDNYYMGFKNVARRNFMLEKLEVPAMVKTLKLPSGKRVLEVGCGQGFALPPLFRLCQPAQLVGIDIDQNLLIMAAKRLRDRRIPAELFLTDVRRMPFPDEAFDVVIDFGTCYHITHKVKALKEITRVLSKGGIFVFETRLNQFLSHPMRSCGCKLPWHLAPALKSQWSAGMWASRVKEGG
jgi:ubiquinone/menaquinone biosynthesis C-methylase UbiE